MAQVLALLGRTDEAIKLSTAVEAAYPFERDELEAASRLLESAAIYAFIGDEQSVLKRLQRLADSKFVSMNLCTIPYDIGHQAIWQLPAAQSFINQQCEPIWERNRRDLLPVLSEMQAAD